MTGQLFRLTTFGESHGPCIGGVIDGCPPGMQLDVDFIRKQLDRRRPGQSKITTQRKETDGFEILSGIFEGRTTGMPLAFIIRNEDAKSSDYDEMKNKFRPSHADFTYHAKYGIHDYRGGGRSSARETAARVFAGAVAAQFLRSYGMEVQAYVSSVGEISIGKKHDAMDLAQTDSNDVRCPDAATAEKMITLIREVRKQGDTVGGVVSCVIRGVPAGLGEPVFDRLHADLGKAMLSINAAKGFEYGSGFAGTVMKGSEHNDAFYYSEDHGRVRTAGNHSGGIQGGISNGEDIYFSVAFKPVATIMQSQETVNKNMEPETLSGKGRHDPCVVPRAVPVVEAMASLVIMDHFLRQAAYQGSSDK